MAFAFSNIILNEAPLSYNAGRLYINGNAIAFSSEVAGGVTGLTIESGDARYVRTSGNQAITGGLKVLSGILGLTGQIQIDPFNSYLYANGTISVDWSEKSLYASDQSISVSWEDRVLGDSSEVISVDWENKIITGNWKTNTVPTLSGHILNKGYFDSVSGSLGGGAIPSDVVRTTGAQSISGAKRFVQSVEISNATGLERMFIAEGGAGYFNVDSDGFVKIHSNSYGSEATFYSESMSFTDGTSDTMLVSDRMLMGEWISDFSPTQTGGLATKGYVDSTSSYTIPFGHASFNPLDSTTYYFGAAFGIVASSSQSTSPASAVPKSGVLKSVIGTATVSGTLSSSETVSFVVYKNGTSVATGAYLMTGRNNVISSGVNSLNIPVSELDTLQLSFVCPAWATNPLSVTHALNAYITLA